MLLRLALDTASHHVAADEDRLAVMDVKTRGEYVTHLARIYGFESVVEDMIARVSDIDPVILRDRQKTARLRSDLLALGSSSSRIASLRTLSRANIRTPAQALGWLYVLERSTRLAGVIRRHVQHLLGADIAVSYFTSGSETAGARFRMFGELLGAYARRYTPSQIVFAANEAFRAQRLWFRCPVYVHVEDELATAAFAEA
ncbi:MAG TPA: biliverdin-producing heme oxygenase [Kofleriaceae bacterium]|nr:biliverdin-producing heme oxygenase [Kofleriaceae bacterium]